MKNILIYQAYGIEDILNECIYSISTLTKFDVEIECIVIYTDNVSYLKEKLPPQFQYQFKELNDSLIKEWKGKHSFVHRVKIKLLQDYIINGLSNESSTVNLLYLDTDTTFIQSPNTLFQKIENNILLMHDNEGVIDKVKGNLIFKRLAKFLRKRKGARVEVKPSQVMYNAGVLGFKNTDLPLLDQVLQLTDEIYDEYPQHISEQLSFSVIFSHQGERHLEIVKPEIFHYWNFKEFRGVMKEFFEKYSSHALILPNIDRIDPTVLHRPKAEYMQLSFFPKNFRKLFGKWKMPEYEI
ncbi:hypothetical protein [Flammeovirga sp. EKP202]|uniref:hypothetical protein n=1 Tax=Flammeovirga sp. EKP202 TaxID=2770592 RepID=UPI00165F55F9|nr:hypothetical protein [Flammeovirga sp. EKP202]MBD0403457.1 hypothetical protein [Flammeovirga sp. EKP202]